MVRGGVPRGPRGTGGRGCRPSAASAPLAWSRGAGAGLNPLSSRREVPMNFATLNKKWFHEVNISVTIPSPTRDAHAQTHARIARRARHQSQIGRTCIYVYSRAYVRAIRTHINGRIYTRSFSHVRSLARSFPRALSLFRAQGRSSVYITGATHAHVRARTHAGMQAGGTRSY